MLEMKGLIDYLQETMHYKKYIFNTLQREDLREDDLPLDLLERKPKEPSTDSCCGEGCSPCVFDIYEQELKLWRKDCAQYFMGNQTSENTKADEYMTPDCYRKCILSEILILTENCSIYRFHIPENGCLNLKNGKHLILRAVVNGALVTRQYTPVSQPNSKGYFDVMIKVYDTGLMSKYVSTWYTGLEVEWRGPFGGFGYMPNTCFKVVMIAGGTGIAPMVQLIYSIVGNEADETFIRLLFCCKAYDEILLKSILDRWKRNWNFTVKYFLSQESDFGRKQYGDEIHYGHIDKNLLSDELDSRKHIQVLICGSKSFNQTVKQFVSEIGFTEHECFVF